MNRPTRNDKQAERGEIEMEAVGQALEIGLGAGFDKAQSCRPRLLQRRRAGPWLCRSGSARSDPAFRAARCAMPISMTSKPGTRCGCDVKRRQRLAAARRRRGAFAQTPSSASVSRRDQRLARRHDEGLQIAADRRRIAGFCRQRKVRCRAGGMSGRRSGYGLRQPATPASRRGGARRTALAATSCRARPPASRCCAAEAQRPRGRSSRVPAG